MGRFAPAAVFVSVVSFFVLPLYEFADIGEHWPHDSGVVWIMLTVLFLVGLTLMLRQSAAVAVRRIVGAQCRDVGRAELERSDPIESASTGLFRRNVYPIVLLQLIEPPDFLILQDFRI